MANVGKAVQGALSAALKDVAPSVASTLGGPMAGHVVRTVSQVLTGRPDAPHDEILQQAKNLSVEQMEALEGIETQMVALVREVHADRANARETEEMRLAHGGWLARNFLYLLATALIFMSALFLGWAAFGWIPETLPDGSLTAAGQAQLRMVDTTQGFILGTVMAGIIVYFFGSTTDSRKKTDMLGLRR